MVFLGNLFLAPVFYGTALAYCRAMRTLLPILICHGMLWGCSGSRPGPAVEGGGEADAQSELEAQLEHLLEEGQ